MSLPELGATKSIILQECSLVPCTWSEIVGEANRSEPTILVHVNELISKKFLEKTADKKYKTTDLGKNLMRLFEKRTEIEYEIQKLMRNGKH